MGVAHLLVLRDRGRAADRVRRPRSRPVSCWIPILIAGLVAASPGRALADCSLTHTGNIPLSDLAGTYRGVVGGLYPDGTSIRPAAHEAIGVQRAQGEIRPLDAQGQPDPVNGRIVLVSLGMSNTMMEFDRFLQIEQADPARNPRLTIVNGALYDQTADQWIDPNSDAWMYAFDQITAANVTRSQVQVAWVKVVRRGFGGSPDPAVNFPRFAQLMQADLETISRNLKTNYPNLKIAYFSSRIRAYVPAPELSPEPAAYESGFAVRWAIASQIQNTGNVSLAVAPWMAWGPYLWADGLTPRSDGLTYACSDLTTDFVHPAAGARQKVSDQLRAFLATDPTATPWFLKPASNPPAIGSMSATPSSGDPGVHVQFNATASDPDGVREYFWNFGDGTSALGPSPQKTFNVAGQYAVRLTVVDQGGNAAQQALTYNVGVVGPAAPTNLHITRDAGN